MTIRRSHEDFQVQELLTDAAQQMIRQESAIWSVYQLTKTGRTTPQTIDELARRLKCPSQAIAFVGLKDKHAVTSQFVSVRLAKSPEQIDGQSWHAKRIGYLDQPLEASMVSGNRFTIVVRSLTKNACDEMDRRAAKLQADHDSSQGQTLYVTNYFGDQRFGHTKQSRGFAARHLIDGDFLSAIQFLIATLDRRDKKNTRQFRKLLSQQWGQWSTVLPKLPRCPERRVVEHLARWPDDASGAFAKLPYFTQQMAVYGYQSYLWNRIASRLLTESNLVAFLTSDEFGDMVFASPADLPADWRWLNLPVPGKSTQPAEPWSHAAAKVLAEESIESFASLKIPGLKRPFFGQADRQLLMLVSDFKMNRPQPDSTDASANRFCRTLGFSLGRGGYATVLLRALGQ